MTRYLELCHEKYRELFSKDWMNIDSEQIDEKNLFYDILDFEKECFILLSKSILSGEYISNDYFEYDLKSFIESTEIEWEESPTKLKEKYLSVSRSISAILMQYSGFYFYAYEKFIIDTSENRLNFYQKSDYVNSPISLVQDVMKVCEFDYGYPLSDKKLMNFLGIYLEIKDHIKSSKDADILFIWEVLFFKCNYIIKRINKKIDFSLLLEVYRITPNTLDLGPLDSLIKKQISFYPLSEEETKRLKDNINSDKPELESLLRLSWSIAKKKDTKDIELMQTVLDIFESNFLHLIEANSIKQSNPIESFNRFSINSVYNFIQNCQFSLQLSYKTFDLKFINNHTDRINKVQKGTFIKNFHPFKKGIDYIIQFIDNKLLNDKQNDIYEFENNIFATLDNFIDKFEEYIRWGENHRFFPFQLTFKESLIDHGDLKLFIPSSFANIIDYKQLEDKLQEYKNQRHFLAIKYETYKSKLAITELNSQFKKDRFNMLQMIILFAGIITFLFGTINIFTQNTDQNLSQLIINTIGLGIILVLFTSTSLTLAPALTNIVDFNEIEKTRRFKVAIGFILVYVIVIISLYKSVQDLHRSQKGYELNQLISTSNNEEINIVENDSLYIFEIKK